MTRIVLAAAAIVVSTGLCFAQQSTQTGEGTVVKGNEVQDTSPDTAKTKKVEQTGSVSQDCKSQTSEAPTKMGDKEPVRDQKC